MKDTNPFDAERDAVLGDLLRRHLDPGGHEAFAAAVVAALPSRQPGSAWDLLARWARPGMAAAAAGLLLAVALWFARRGHEPLPDLAVRGTSAVESLAASAGRASHDDVLRATLEAGR